MNVRGDLVRATVYQALEVRELGTEDAYRHAVTEIVTLHRIAPLVEHAVEIKEARRALMLAEAAEAARVWEDDPEIAAQIWGHHA